FDFFYPSQRYPLLHYSFFFFLRPRRPPRSPLFPYTTLFRSLPRRSSPTAGSTRCRPTSGTASSRSTSPERRMWHARRCAPSVGRDRKSTRLNSSHVAISYAVFCLKKKNFVLVCFFN